MNHSKNDAAQVAAELGSDPTAGVKSPSSFIQGQRAQMNGLGLDSSIFSHAPGSAASISWREGWAFSRGWEDGLRGNKRRMKDALLARKYQQGYDAAVRYGSPEEELPMTAEQFDDEMAAAVERSMNGPFAASTQEAPMTKEEGMELEAAMQQKVEDAVRTLIIWAGDDPDREGLIDTPVRVRRAYQEFFAGYKIDPVELLRRSFEETDNYDELVLLRNIRLETHCEHHMVPIIGVCHIAYIPGANGRVVGISKLARIVDVFAKRLQIQEKLTAQIANLLMEEIQPLGVGVVIEAAHQCMTTRGVHKPGVTMVTSRMLGVFRDDPVARRELLSLIGNPSSSERA